MNLMVNTNQKAYNRHTKNRERSPSIVLKEVIKLQGKRAREGRNREVQRQPEKNKIAIRTYISMISLSNYEL